VAKVYDWIIKKKGETLFLGKTGYVVSTEDAWFVTHSARPYLKASQIKQAIFKQSKMQNLDENMWMVWGGIRERNV